MHNIRHSSDCVLLHIPVSVHCPDQKHLDMGYYLFYLDVPLSLVEWKGDGEIRLS